MRSLVRPLLPLRRTGEDAMDRESLIGRLLWLRELRLHKEVAQLKARAAALADHEQTRERARDAAAADDSAAELRDRGLVGEVRLQSSRAAREATVQVTLAGRQVAQARRLTDAMRAARADLEEAKRESRARVQQNESEHFQNWKRSERPVTE